MVKVTLDMRQQATAAHMRQSMLITATEMARPMLFSKAIRYYRLYTHLHFPARRGKNFFSDGIHAHFCVAGFTDHQLNPGAGSAKLFAGTAAHRAANPLVHRMEQGYLKVLEAVLRHPRKLFAGAGLMLALSLVSSPLIGTEFMPKLDEGNVWLTITLPTPVSLNKAKRLEIDMRTRLPNSAKRNRYLPSWAAPKTALIQKVSTILKFLSTSSQRRPGVMTARMNWSRPCRSAWRYSRACSSISPR